MRLPIHPVAAALGIALAVIAAPATTASANTTRTYLETCVAANSIDPVTSVEVEFVDSGAGVDITRYRLVDNELAATVATFAVYDPLLSTSDSENDYPVWHTDTWTTTLGTGTSAWRSVNVPDLPYTNINFTLQNGSTLRCTQGTTAWQIVPLAAGSLNLTSFLECRIGTTTSVAQVDYWQGATSISTDRWRFRSTTAAPYAKLTWTPTTPVQSSVLGAVWETPLPAGTWSSWKDFGITGVSFSFTFSVKTSTSAEQCGAFLGSLPYSQTDSDSDGLADGAEADFGTNPNKADTDDGGRTDYAEVALDRTDPLLTNEELGSTWPNASNTGPTGTLTPYTGPCTITTANTVITSALITYSDPGCPAVIIRAAGVRIENSEIRNRIEIESGDVTITDSIIDGRDLGWRNGMIRFGNYTLDRVEILGGKDSAHCNGTCTIRNSWLHAQDEVPVGLDIHAQAVLSSGGANLTFVGNTLDCDTLYEPIGGGGCTAHLSLFAESATGPLTNVLVEGNLFPAGPDAAWCVYAGGDKPGSPLNTGIVIKDNRWVRGANNKGCAFGPITSIGPGTTLSGNQWITGGVVN